MPQRASLLQLFNRWTATIDWRLLLFLLLFLDVKLPVKALTLALTFAFDRDVRFGLSLRSSRLPLFYPAIVILGVVGWLVHAFSAPPHYHLVAMFGVLYWLMAFLACHRVRRFVELGDAERIHNAVLAFFIVNAVISFGRLALIMIDAHALNPYRYQGNYQQYFISTGDYIRGVTFDISTTNAVLNAFGVIYFLSRNRLLPGMMCMAVMLLTGSNFMNMALLGMLVLLFAVKSTRPQKSMIVICLVMVVVFLAKISPQNATYTQAAVGRIMGRKQPAAVAVAAHAAGTPAAVRSEAWKVVFAKAYLDSLDRPVRQPVAKPGIAARVRDTTASGGLLLPKDSIHTPTFQSRKTTPKEQLSLVKFINADRKALKLSAAQKPAYSGVGKIIAARQTLYYFKAHPQQLLLGAGIGNFSSKIAFKATALGVEGGYPKTWRYIHPAFLGAHLDLYLAYFSKSAGYHSLLNSPFSVYDQLFAEYGVLGLWCFVAGYLWFFAAKYRQLTYGMPLLGILAAVLFTDYWFEQLSVIVFFELLLFLDLGKRAQNSVQHAG